MANGMTMERLHDLLDAYGAAPSRWPEAERDAAEAMIASSDEARAAFAEAARLDAMLDEAAPPPAADRLGWRLRGLGPRAEPARIEARRSSWFGATPMAALARVAAIALALVGGVGIGIALPGGTSHRDGAQVVASLEESDTETDNSLALSAAFEESDDDDGLVTLAGYDTSLPLQ